MFGLTVLILFPACMILATATDLTTMKIPNKIVFALLAGFAALAPFSGLALEAIGMHLAVGAFVFAIGFILWMLRVLGAGDVKLLAATALWLGPTQAVPYLMYVGIIGGWSIILILLFRRSMLPSFLLQVNWVFRLHEPGGHIPYALALGPAALLVFMDSPLARIAMNGI